MHHRWPRIASVARRLSLVLCLALPPTLWAVTEDLKIPNLGESSTSLFSPDYEYRLGRMWLRSFRGQAPLMNDPLLHSYLESYGRHLDGVPQIYSDLARFVDAVTGVPAHNFGGRSDREGAGDVTV